jgi:hypothetical protein
MNVTDPMVAAPGPSLHSRRNQYMARPVMKTLRMAMRVRAGAMGSTNAIHVRGKSNALCGLAKKGAPAKICGFQIGNRPRRISWAEYVSQGSKRYVASVNRGLEGTKFGSRLRQGSIRKRLSAAETTLPG